MSVSRDQAKSLIGKHVYVLTRKGEVRDGILQKVSKDKIYLRSGKKPVSTNAFFNPFTPLILFDLLAIAQTPFIFRRPFFF